MCKFQQTYSILRKLILFLLISFVSLHAASQPPRKFNPRQFEKELQQYIIQQAGLTPAESARFFPLFDEMQRKQRKLFDEMRFARFVDTSDDKAALRAIRKMDEIDIEIKKLQQQYHIKFCKVIPAGKVFRVIQADDKFHRRVFKRFIKSHGNQ